MYRAQFSAWAISKTERACWENLVQQIIDKSNDHWRDKLKAVVRVNDRQIVQMFRLSGLYAAVLCYVGYE